VRWKPYAYARKTTAECYSDSPLASVVRILIEEDIGSILVKDRKGGYAGILTDKKLLGVIAKGADLSDMSVGELDLEPIVFVDKNADIDEVRAKFGQTHTTRLVMTDDEGRVVGVLKKKNIDRFWILHTVKTTVGRILRK